MSRLLIMLHHSPWCTACGSFRHSFVCAQHVPSLVCNLSGNGFRWQGWGVMEYRRGNFDRARELLQEGVWADSGSKNVAYVWQVMMAPPLCVVT